MTTELETYYYREEMPKIRQRISEFKEEIGNQGKCMRLRYLYDSVMQLDLELIDRQMRYRQAVQADSPYPERALISLPIPEIEKEIKKLEKEIRFLVKGSQGKDSEITPGMIEQAREYPISNLIEVKKNKAQCPFHDDHHPSMGIKNNRFHCFSCGEKGDVIDFVIKRDRLSFREAILILGG